MAKAGIPQQIAQLQQQAARLALDLKTGAQVDLAAAAQSAEQLSNALQSLSQLWTGSQGKPAAHPITGISMEPGNMDLQQEPEQRFRQMFERHNAIMLLLDPESGAIFDANPAAEAFYGYPRSQLCKMNITDINIQPPEHVHAEKQRAARQEQDQFIFPHRLASGEVRTVETRASPIEVDGRQLLFSIIQDITECKKAEDELKRLNRELRAISNCNQALVRAENELSIVNDICRIVCDEAGYRMAWVGYAEQDEEQTIRPVAWAGAKDGYLAKVQISWADTELGQGPAGTAIRLAKTVYIQDFRTDSTFAPWRENAIQHGYLCSISMPLKDEHLNTFGVLNIYSAVANAFNDSEARLLEDLAGNLGFGIAVLRARANRKRTEEALQQSEAKFRAVIENSSEGILFGDANAVISFRSPSYTRLNGFSDEERIGRSGFETVHPNDLAKIRQYWDEVVQHPGISIKTEYRIQHKDGAWRWIETTAQNLLQNPDIKEIVFTSRDISEQKRTEQALRESEEKYRLIVENMAQGAFIQRADGRMLDCNPAVLHMFGLTREQFMNRTSLDPRWKVIHEDGSDFPGDQHPSMQALRTGNPVRDVVAGVFNDVRKDYAWVSISAIPMFRPGEDRPYQTFVTLHDLTGRKQAEEALQESERRFHQMFQNHTSVMLFVEPESGEIVDANPAAESFYGYPHSRLCGLNISAINPLPEEHLHENRQKAVREEQTQFVVPHRLASGEIRTVEIRASSIETGDRRLLFSIIQDITERKRAEDELHRLNRELRAISDCNQVLVRAEHEQSLLEEVCRIICEVAGYRMAWVGYAEQDAAKTIRPVAWAGHNNGYVESLNLSWDDSMRGQGPSGRAIRTSQSIYIQDFEADPRLVPWRQSAQQHQFRCSISLPLKDSSATPFGCLNIYSTVPNAYTLGEVRLLEELAADLAFGISTLRARDERQKAQEALRRSEARFRAVVENSNDGILFVDANAIIQYRSPSFSRINGYSPEERFGRVVFETVHPDDLKRISVSWHDVLATPGQPGRSEYRIRHQDGSWRWIEASVINLLENPDVESVVIAARDITERKRAEDALQASEETLRAFVNALPSLSCLFEPGGSLLVANESIARPQGKKPADLIGTNIFDLMIPETAEYRRSWVKEVLRSKKAIDFEDQARGRDYLSHLEPLFGPRGEVNRIAMIALDITERKRAEEALRLSEERFAKAFEASPSLELITKIAEARLVAANQAFLNAFGYTWEEITGRTTIELGIWEDPGIHEKWLEQYRNGVKKISFEETSLHTKDGRTILCKGTINILEIDGEEHALACFENLSPRREMEAKLREHEARIQACVEQAPVAISISRDGITLYGNQALVKIFGADNLDELRRTPIYTRFAPEEQEISKERMLRRSQGLPALNNYEATLLRKDGSHFLANIMVDTVNLPDGKALVAFITDITDRKKIEVALLESEAKFRAVIEQNTEGVSLIDEDDRLIEWNHAMERITGIPAKEALGLDNIDLQGRLISPEHRTEQRIQRARTIMSDLVRSGQSPIFSHSIEIKIYRQDGREVIIEQTIFPVRTAHSCHVASIIRDITDQKRAEEFLRLSEERYRLLADNAQDVIWTMDNEYRLTYISPSILALRGFTAEEAMQEKYDASMTPESWRSVQESLAQQNKSAGEIPAVSQIEIQQYCKDGSLVWAEIVSRAILDKNGKHVGFIGVSRNINERKRAEADLHYQISENLRRTGELEALAEISAAVRQAKTRADMIEQLVDRAAAATHSQTAALASLEGSSILVFTTGTAGENAGSWRQVSQNPGRGIFWEVIRSGQPRFIQVKELAESPQVDDLFLEMYPAQQACILAPLKSGSATIGLLILGFNGILEKPEDEVRLAGAIAEIAGNALHRMSVTETLERMVEHRSHELDSIYQVTMAASENTNLQAALQKALELGLQAVKTETGGVFLLDETGDTINLIAHHGYPQDVLARIEHQEMKDSLSGWVIRQNSPLIISDLASDPRAGWSTRLGEYMSFFGLPMRAHEHVNGVLCVYRPGGDQLNLDETMLLSFIASHLALVVENARLYQKAEQSAIMEERARLARDLHDSITQMLYSTTLYSAGAREFGRLGDMEHVMQYVGQIGEISQQALREMRLMIYELRSPALDTMGLIGALQNRLDAVERRLKINAVLEVGDLPVLAPRVEENLYRISIEALNNALKHASANRMNISIFCSNGDLVLIIQDNGTGFDFVQTKGHGGIGLHSIQERADQMGATLKIESSPGNGTQVEVRVPENHKEQH
jgi:PAS domain S-box-containing protein